MDYTQLTTENFKVFRVQDEVVAAASREDAARWYRNAKGIKRVPRPIEISLDETFGISLNENDTRWRKATFRKEVRKTIKAGRQLPYFVAEYNAT